MFIGSVVFRIQEEMLMLTSGDLAVDCPDHSVFTLFLLKIPALSSAYCLVILKSTVNIK